MIEVELKDLPAALDSCERNVRRAIARGALAGAHRGRALIVKRTPVDMGPLKAEWRVKPGAVDFESGMGEVLATLVNDSKYIGPVENGARPHPVSPEGWAAIYEWVRRHYRGSKSEGYKLGGKGRMRRQGAGADPNRPFHGSDPEIEAITNAIVWKIRTQGQKATYFVRNSLEDLKAVMIDELNRALAHAQDGGA